MDNNGGIGAREAVISNNEKWMETKMDMRWKTMNFSKIQKEWMSNDDFEWNVWCEQQGGDSTNHNGKLNLWLVFRVFVHKRVCTTKALSSQYLFFNWIVIFYSEQHTCVYVGCWCVFSFNSFCFHSCNDWTILILAFIFVVMIIISSSGNRKSSCIVRTIALASSGYSLEFSLNGRSRTTQHTL